MAPESEHAEQEVAEQVPQPQADEDRPVIKRNARGEIEVVDDPPHKTGGAARRLR